MKGTKPSSAGICVPSKCADNGTDGNGSKVNEIRFHNSAIIAEVDYYNQLISHIIHFVGDMSTCMLISSLDYWETVASSTSPAGLGTG
jgi:hypothetical protein